MSQFWCRLSGALHLLVTPALISMIFNPRGGFVNGMVFGVLALASLILGWRCLDAANE